MHVNMRWPIEGKGTEYVKVVEATLNLKDLGWSRNFKDSVRH
jgi:hypothetical protein